MEPPESSGNYLTAVALGRGRRRSALVHWCWVLIDLCGAPLLRTHGAALGASLVVRHGGHWLAPRTSPQHWAMQIWSILWHCLKLTVCCLSGRQGTGSSTITSVSCSSFCSSQCCLYHTQMLILVWILKFHQFQCGNLAHSCSVKIPGAILWSKGFKNYSYY